MSVKTVQRCTLAVVVVGALAAAPGAGASAASCNAATSNMSCLRVTMKGPTVTDVLAGKAKDAFICNYSAKVVFYRPDGTTHTLSSGVIHGGACTARKAWVSFPMYAKFPHGTRVCTTFYESGKQQGGRPCATI